MLPARRKPPVPAESAKGAIQCGKAVASRARYVQGVADPEAEFAMLWPSPIPPRLAVWYQVQPVGELDREFEAQADWRRRRGASGQRGEMVGCCRGGEVTE